MQLAARTQLLAARNELADLQSTRRRPGNRPAAAARDRTLADAHGQDGLRPGGPFPLARRAAGVRALGGDGRDAQAGAPYRVYKLKDASEVTETLGPIRGFRMEYTLRRGQKMAPVGRGSVAVQQTIELERFILIPVAEDLGEPSSPAYRENSELPGDAQPLRSQAHQRHRLGLSRQLRQVPRR